MTGREGEQHAMPDSSGLDARPPKILLEPVALGARSEFIRLAKAYFQELDLEPSFHGLDKDLTAPLSTYRPPRAGLWLARTAPGRAAFGMIGVMPLSARSCELKRLYVATDHRRRGWGRVLLEHALQFARAQEYLEMLVALRHDQRDALSLAETMAFTPCARYNRDRQVGLFLSRRLGNVD